MTRSNIFSSTQQTIKAVAGALTLIVLFASAWLGLNAYVDSRVEAAINDPDYLSELAEKVRPAVIVSRSGSLIADLGGLAFIEPPIVEEAEHGYRITINPREHLDVAPIVEPLEGGLPTVIAERGPGISWVVTVTLGGIILSTRGGTPQESQRIRIEIVR